jgi:hypothetical protein
MISFGKEAEAMRRGLNFRSVSDGGFEFVLYGVGPLRIYFRMRGFRNPVKPRFILDWEWI